MISLGYQIIYSILVFDMIINLNCKLNVLLSLYTVSSEESDEDDSDTGVIIAIVIIIVCLLLIVLFVGCMLWYGYHR